MNSQIKEQFIAETFAQYDLNSYQKACITKLVDGCIDLISYETGSKGLSSANTTTLAGLIKGHITNILNVLDVRKKDGQRRPQEAQS